MGSNNGDEATRVPIDALERHLLASPPLVGTAGDGAPTGAATLPLHTASFSEDEEMEEKFVRYQTALWVLYSLVLILAWGIGLLMLLYLPLRIYNSRKEFRSKRLYLTPDAIVYEVCNPAVLPLFGHLTKQKYILLPSVADVVVEQGFLQSYFGIHNIRIQHKGIRRPAADDLSIQGVPLPTHFQRAVQAQLSIIRNEQLGKQPSSSSSALPPGELILQKLDEVEGSLKKVNALIETRTRASQMLD